MTAHTRVGALKGSKLAIKAQIVIAQTQMLGNLWGVGLRQSPRTTEGQQQTFA